MSTTNDQLALAINNLAKALCKKHRRRLWLKLVLFGVAIILLCSFFFAFWQQNYWRSKPHVALIKLDGIVAADGAIDADRVTESLHHAYEDKGTRGIILRINSPGGSPVQASYIYQEIRRLRQLHPQIPVYAVCSDLCASAGYFIAVAAQAIYADKNSLIGAIGTIMANFGFVEAMRRLGIERRVFISGKDKDFMDPYAPLIVREKRIYQEIVDKSAQQFIAAVKQGRGKHLKKDVELFSGRTWLGVQGRELGLIDAYGSVDDVARELFKQMKVIDYTTKPMLIERLADNLGMSIFHGLLSQLSLHFVI